MTFDSDTYNVTDFVIANRIRKNSEVIAKRISAMEWRIQVLNKNSKIFESSREAAFAVLQGYVRDGILNSEDVNREYNEIYNEEKAKRGIREDDNGKLYYDENYDVEYQQKLKVIREEEARKEQEEYLAARRGIRGFFRRVRLFFAWTIVIICFCGVACGVSSCVYDIVTNW